MSKKQTVFFTSVDYMKKEHTDPNDIVVSAQRLAWYKQKKLIIHQDTVYWVDIELTQQKGFEFTKRDRTQSSFTIHSQLVVS